MSAALTHPSLQLIAELMAMVSLAENAFHSRWRLSTLQRIDPELHQLLLEQVGLYDRALVVGPDEEAREQAEAMVRGWRAACAALESPLQPDDAYLTGFDPETNLLVIIGDRAGSGAGVFVAKGQKTIAVTPDEVARIIAGTDAIVATKEAFPDAEVVRVKLQTLAVST